MADQQEVKCPAAEIQHPVLSTNEFDVECRIQGNLRPGAQAGKHCCAEYATCPVWVAMRKVELDNRAVRVAAMMRRRASHTLAEVPARELVRA